MHFDGADEDFEPRKRRRCRTSKKKRLRLKQRTSLEPNEQQPERHQSENNQQLADKTREQSETQETEPSQAPDTQESKPQRQQEHPEPVEDKPEHEHGDSDNNDDDDDDDDDDGDDEEMTEYERKRRTNILRNQVLSVGCRRALVATDRSRAFSSRSSLPDGFRSPQAVADAVAAALAAENDPDGLARRSKGQAPTDPNAAARLERRRLDGDVIATQSISVQQLMHPKNTPDWQLIKPEHFEKVPTPKDWHEGLEQLQKRIGVQFQDVTLLKSALTHHGCLPMNPVPEDIPVVRLSNRSLEFLGDSLLGAAAAAYVYQMLPRHQEGQLSRAKSALVKNETLSTISKELGITDLLLWPIEFKEARAAPFIVKGRVTIAAGAVESLIGAIYLDQGMETAMNFVATQILPRSVEYATRDVIWEPIVELQNLLQGHYYGTPVFKYLPAPVNSGKYTVELYVKGRPILKATGASYKLARGRAAEAAYWHFEKLLGPVP
ncbi:hypothetical protein PHYSODRAFT_337611 [Phytophthora sojae]|uniref:RNase III domain-containing protein n=1 Tax=Phytophthora sojae (strain P6497) TaxID=1094619 RepID=G5A1N8_PHYSP|nr:hypothetical protein PHYSODRAFT_337611 [Phytophthora sojae]EGZ10836.1 hypothetical protein PHYSODRAFT_337611 [Phytophthora sojae]|eukprot:XP_009533581.1 hypothetical protein PHYSODRAFT_337611 [Phytophthora sojae]